MSETNSEWTFEIVSIANQHLFGKVRTVITYNVITEHGEYFTGSKITADRMFIRPSRIQSDGLRNKWQKTRFVEDEGYIFSDPEEHKPFRVSPELIRLLDQMLLDDVLGIDPKLK